MQGGEVTLCKNRLACSSLVGDGDVIEARCYGADTCQPVFAQSLPLP